MNYHPALVQLPLVCEAGVHRILTPADTHRVCADLANLAQEALHVLTLSSRNHLINRHLITLGLVDSSPAHCREVFRPAIQDGAAAVIIVHGHPSGDPSPSAEDLRVTRQLIEAGKILGIQVIDHVIIGRVAPGTPGEPLRLPYLSIREAGLCAFT